MNESKLKPMLLIHTAFFFAIITFALVAYLQVKDVIHFSPGTNRNDALYPLFPILSIVFIFLGFFMFNRQIAAIDSAMSSDDKIMRYQTAFLIRCAFIEAGALLNIVAFLLTGNSVFLIFVGCALIAFVMIRPAKQKIIDTLNLQFPETEKL
jgi:uncharacterized membrane protein YozB (DUF420 family)